MNRRDFMGKLGILGLIPLGGMFFKNDKNSSIEYFVTVNAPSKICMKCKNKIDFKEAPAMRVVKPKKLVGYYHLKCANFASPEKKRKAIKRWAILREEHNMMISPKK